MYSKRKPFPRVLWALVAYTVFCFLFTIARGADLTASGNLYVKGRGVFGKMPMITGYGLDVNDSDLSTAVQTGIYAEPTCNSAASTSCSANRSKVQLKAGSYTVPEASGHLIEQPAVGAGVTVTNMYGLNIKPVTGGVTNYALHTERGWIDLNLNVADSMNVRGGAGVHVTTTVNLDSTVQLGYANFTHQVSGGITVIATSGRTLDASMYLVAINGSGFGDTMKVNLPSASTCSGREYILFKTDTSGGAVQIKPASGDTIVGQTTGLYLLGNDESVCKIRSTGAGHTPQGSSWQVEYLSERGHFRSPVTGFSAADTVLITWVRPNRRIVTLHFPAKTGTSNATSISLGSVPTKLNANGAEYQVCPVVDNSNNGTALFGSPSGSNIAITLLKANVTTLLLGAGAFTASGTKSWSECTLTYVLPNLE